MPLTEIQSPIDSQTPYAYIDVMRGLAIMLVVTVHVSQAVFKSHSFLLAVSEYCQLGVQMFFVASALTLCLSMSRKVLSKDETIRFFLRRFFRIAPLYYTGIFFYFLLWHGRHNLVSGAGDMDFTAGNIAANILFIHGIAPSANNTVVPGGWSIGCEMLFYAVFPLLFRYVTSRGRAIAFIIGSLLANFIFQASICQVRGQPVQVINDSFAYFFIINQLPVFGCGLLLFFSNGIRSKRLWKYFNPVAAAFFLLAAIVVWNSSSFFGLAFGLVPTLAGLSFYHLGRSLSVSRMDSPVARCIAEIGRKSFSIYVFHFVFAWDLDHWIIQRFGMAVNGTFTRLFFFGFLLLLTIGASYLVAWGTHHVIEEKGIEIGKRLSGCWVPVQGRLANRQRKPA